MRKSKILRFFGGQELTAHALKVTGQAVRKWPDPVSDAIADRVVMAGIRLKGTKVTRAAFPQYLVEPNDTEPPC